MDLKLKIPQRKKSVKKGSLVINPEAYWEIVLFLILVAGIFAFTFGFLLFKKVDRGAILSEGEVKSAPLVKEERLSEVLKYFEGRAQKSRDIIASPSPIIDPSL